MDIYQQYIHKSRYARFLPEQKRREHWPETVIRYIDFMKAHLKDNVPGNSLKKEEWDELAESIENFWTMPSMRAMMTAGPALLRDNTAGYNCAYVTIDDPKAFDEAMHILMCGTGVGFSVERQYINKLPEIPEKMFDSDSVIHVRDSKEGWAKALRMLISLLYAGEMPTWDVSKVRLAGAQLKTFGGRASGPEPLMELFVFVTKMFKQASGRKLTSIECHDIMCKIGEVVVVGGVRRSAMISLSNLSDDRMRSAKSGEWWHANVQRALSNNSAVYNERPTMSTFLNEWTSLYESKSGERGIFSRDAAKRIAARNGRRDANYEFGTNPCSEIILRPNEFCNLTEVVARADDTDETLERKVRIATIIGTIQSSLTHFPYLRKVWQRNTEEERLLGVSITGIYDCPLLNKVNDDVAQRLLRLKEIAIETNSSYAYRFGIPKSAAITCVKPSGTVSQLTDSASGIHQRYDPYYIRRVRSDNKDPLTQMLIDAGVPSEPDVTKLDQTTIFSFPQKAPKGAVVRDDITSTEHLDLWLQYQRYWCEHKPSVTISVKEDEWMAVGSWVYDNFDEISGVSFLPHDGGSYRQAPYETITREAYLEAKKLMPKDIKWDEFVEETDMVEGAQTLACSAASGGCEV
jgi:ribonucleoside-triphosphate reductase